MYRCSPVPRAVVTLTGSPARVRPVDLVVDVGVGPARPDPEDAGVGDDRVVIVGGELPVVGRRRALRQFEVGGQVVGVDVALGESSFRQSCQTMRVP